MNTTMSTRPVILAIIIAFALFGCAKKPAETLIGEWKETDSTGKTTSLVLNADKSFKLVQGNLVLDGATVSGKSEWRLDTSHEPMSLDLVITLPTGQQETLPMIVRLITERLEGLFEHPAREPHTTL